MHDWIDHDGNGMQVDGDCIVEVKFRDGGTEAPTDALYWQQPYAGDRRDYWTWRKTAPQDDIVAYRIVEASK